MTLEEADGARPTPFDAQLEALVAAGPSHPSEVFRDVDDEFWLWAHTEGRDRSPFLEGLLPDLPDPAQQHSWTGKSGFGAQLEGFEVYRAVRDLHARHFGSLRDVRSVLDFGCGWGRVISYFLTDVDPGVLLGTDRDEANVAFCRASNPWCSFGRNDADPPLPFADRSLDLVYAYSVFSHFGEDMHWSWLTELERVLRPGGAAVLTVRPRRFIEHARLQRERGSTDIVARMFPDDEAALAAYDTGEFCFTPYYARGRAPWWGEACIPEAYIRRRWGELFDVLDIDTARLKQHAVVLRA